MSEILYYPFLAESCLLIPQMRWEKSKRKEKNAQNLLFRHKRHRRERKIDSNIWCRVVLSMIYVQWAILSFFYSSFITSYFHILSSAFFHLPCSLSCFLSGRLSCLSSCFFLYRTLIFLSSPSLFCHPFFASHWSFSFQPLPLSTYPAFFFSFYSSFCSLCFCFFLFP